MPPFVRQYFWPLLTGLLCAILVMALFPNSFGVFERKVQLHIAPSYSATQAAPESYALAVTMASPAVVNLYSTKVINNPQHPALEDPVMQHFFRDNLPQQRRLEASLGSAVILSKDGYLLTNNHVIAGAEQIVVALKDGRETFATVVGTDPETDLAVLKIELSDLPAITLGHSDKIQIGDVVLAIGNPFGVGQTVTMGIVSATGRNQLGINTYEDFIQTDAAINPGNSGGALIDTRGNLLGINTAIFSRTGGSQGIGFAIPAKLALDVMNSIVEQGRVVRGWLGIEVQALTPELIESFGVRERSGFLVAGVVRGGPAEKIGLQPGDIILEIAGQSSNDGRSAMNQVARMRPGSKVELKILRNNREIQFRAEVGERP